MVVLLTHFRVTSGQSHHAWQSRVASHEPEDSPLANLQFRNGINLGDVIVENGDKSIFRRAAQGRPAGLTHRDLTKVHRGTHVAVGPSMSRLPSNFTLANGIKSPAESRVRPIPSRRVFGTLLPINLDVRNDEHLFSGRRPTCRFGHCNQPADRIPDHHLNRQ